MDRGRILAIDDDPISLAITGILLESDGWTVLTAEGGQQALDLLADAAAGPGAGDPPDCILADLRMPGLSGAALARQLREAAPAARLIAMTATPPPAAEGYEAVLAKPLTLEALRAALSANAGPPAATTQPAPAPQTTPPPTPPPAKAPAPPPKDGDSAGCIDEAVFDRLRSAMSAASLAEVIEVFLEDAGKRIATMRGAEAATVRREAHTIKGGAAMIGAREAARIASEIESGVDDPGERSGKLDELEAQCRRAEGILLQRLKL